MFDWTTLRHENINIYAENITDKISEFCNKTISNKLVTIRPADPPWFYNFIRKIIRKRKRAHRKAELLNSTDSWEKFRKLRNQTVNTIKKTKNDLNNKIAEKLKSENITSKDWWKTFKLLLGKDKREAIPPLTLNGKSVTDPAEKANIFNTYFQSFLDDLDKPVPILPEPTHTLPSIMLTCEEVCAVLKTLITGKACGPDQINNRILKEVADALCSPLTDLFNFSLRNSVVPDIWKKQT